MQGKIVKGIAGFYYVHAGTRTYECRVRGALRKESRKPLVGDDVEFDVLDEDKALGNVVKLLPRRSELIRPAVANVDQALIIFSIVSPEPNLNLLDRFLVRMHRRKIPCIVCFNKQDIDRDGDGRRYERIYSAGGYRTLTVSARAGTGIDALKAMLACRTTTVAGPSGVGKSSIVNCLQSEVVMETGEISAKIERGKHTTRHTELLAAGENTYILDTPGFSSLELCDMQKEELSACYPEFTEYEKSCKFADCSHINEPVCGVREGVEKGGISRIRYENYCLLYEELKNQRRFCKKDK